MKETICYTDLELLFNDINEWSRLGVEIEVNKVEDYYTITKEKEPIIHDDAWLASILQPTKEEN